MPSIVNNQVVIGLEEIRGKLALLGGRLATNVVRRGLRAGAVVIQNDARRRVRKRSGALGKAIVAATDTEDPAKLKINGIAATLPKGVKEVKAYVRIKKDAFKLNAKGKLKRQKHGKDSRGKKILYKRGDIYPRNYAHLVEFGTRPHAVGKGSKLKRGVQRGLMHPGARPYPFMRPALDTKGREAQRVAIEVIERELAKELAKMSKTRRAAG